MAKPTGARELEIWPDHRQLSIAGQAVAVPARAFDVLMALVDHRERVVAKDELLDLVWPNVVVEEHNLHTQVSVLRKLVGERAIATIPGRGYRFVGRVCLHTSSPSHASDPIEQTGSGTSPYAAAVKEVGNLPQILPRLFGRDGDVEELADQVRAHRAVTIVGPGGIGKTSLACAVASRLRPEFADRVWVIQFAPVADTSLVPSVVAQALGLTLPGIRSAAEELLDALRNRAALLVLDNCEHLLDAVSALARSLLDHAPQVRLLTTSQERLKTADEHVFRIGGLSLPASVDVPAMQGSAAVELLVARVQALDPAFALTPHTAADVAEVCRRLDGLPLAIELAAARVPLLGVAGVRASLQERFRVLTGGARTALRRHQTLRETLDWSYGLLKAEERTVFRRTGVFAGSFTMAVAQQVVGDSQLDSWAVLEHLGALLDKSLVMVEAGEPPRYRLLESARTYALEKLREADEFDATSRRQAQALVTHFEVREEQLWTIPIRTRVSQLAPDIDNLRTALGWCARSEADAELHIRLASESAYVWVESGNRIEGQVHCERAMGRIDANTPPLVEARMLVSWSTISHPVAGPAQLAASERAIALYRESRSWRRLYSTMGQYAIAAALGGHVEASARAVEEMASLHDPAWPAASRCGLLLAKARLVELTDSDQSGALGDLATEMLQIGRAEADTWWIAMALSLLAQDAARRSDFEEAIARGREVVALVRQERPEAQALGFAMGHLCRALIAVDELDEALMVAREAASQYASHGFLWFFLTTVAHLALKRGRFSEAAMALGRSDAANAWRDAAPPPARLRQRQAVLNQLQEVFAGPELERLMARGAASSDEEIARIGLAN